MKKRKKDQKEKGKMAGKGKKKNAAEGLLRRNSVTSENKSTSNRPGGEAIESTATTQGLRRKRKGKKKLKKEEKKRKPNKPNLVVNVSMQGRKEKKR